MPKEGFVRREPSVTPVATTRQSTTIFYGWVIVGCAFVILCVAYGIQFSFGVFMPAIEADTGWDRARLSLPYSLYVFVYSALGVVAGRWTDRWGPRAVITGGGCLLGLGIVLTSQVRALWQLYLFLGVIAACGMSAAYVPCNATVVRWFIRRRGLALSITSSGASFGNFVFPPLAAALIAAYGWRTAYQLLGVIATVAIALCATCIVRDPERMQLHPDGDAPDTAPSPKPSHQPPPPSEGWTLAEARRTSTFWLLNLIFTMTWLVVFFPMIHLVPFALDLGLPQLQAAMTVSVIGVAGFAGRLLMGPLSDRLGRKPALGLCLLLQALAFLGFILSTGLVSLYTAAAVFGFSYGGATTLFPAIVGDYFGRLAVGAIVGFIFSLAGSTAAFGPVLAGYLYHVTGHYDVAFALSAALNGAGLALLLFLRQPRRAK
ncbi:MAG: MFS transporter [Candidatus Binatia bacterium]|nr:MFS transporter [Candidatus Binatia bacterium]